MNNKTQRQKLLEALKQGPVNSYKATYLMGVKQAPTRIKELKDLGYNITSVVKKDRSVDWVLDSRGDYRIGRPSEANQILVQSPKLEDQYVFIGNRAVPVENLEPVQEVLI